MLKNVNDATGMILNGNNDTIVPLMLYIGVTETDNFKDVEVEFQLAA